MVDKAYFFDSYAIIEIIKGNSNYQEYKECEVVLTKLNLFEVYFKLLKEFTEQEAEKFLIKSYELVADYDADVIRLAVKFRIANLKRDLSMTDCIGYILAKMTGIRFLTGDEQFKNMENVEYVK